MLLIGQSTVLMSKGKPIEQRQRQKKSLVKHDKGNLTTGLCILSLGFVK